MRVKLSGIQALQAAAVLLPMAILAAAWKWTDLREWADPDRLAEWLEPYRTNWIAAPLILLVFVVAELFLFPVLALIFACGVVFGPWLGTVYAFAGTLASSVLPFLLGRRVGREKLERLGGAAVRSLEKVLRRRGVVAVFLVRKIPAPFTLVNMVCGASPLSLRDFLVGTVLGMGTGIVLITVLGDRLVEIARDPSPRQIAISALLLFVPVVPAILIQRRLNQRTNRRAELRG
jgi:phospholipase D1/2